MSLDSDRPAGARGNGSDQEPPAWMMEPIPVFDDEERAEQLLHSIRMAATPGNSHADDQATDLGRWPAGLDLEAMALQEPEKPRFIMPDWLPAGYATLLAGHGGAGKSGIALQLAVCIAAGVPFVGMEVERRKVLYLSCEDRADVLHWRLTRICAHLGLDLAKLAGWLEIVDLVGHDSVLWERDPKSGYTITPAFQRLDERMQECQADLLIVDGISDTYGGNENSRSEVKRFINGLVALILAKTGAVLLVGHIAKPTAASQRGAGSGQRAEGYSGSTAWHNSVRARWYLRPEGGDSEEGAELSGDLILELQKSNLGRADQMIRFAWDDAAHLFVGRVDAGPSRFDRAHQDRTEQEGILRAFERCASAVPPMPVPAATTGQRTAYNVLRARPEFPETLRTGKASRTRFWRQIEQLRRMHLVEEASYRRPNRHQTAVLAITSEGVRRCAE